MRSRRRVLVTLLIGGVLAGCGRHSDDGVLPPPPRSGMPRLGDVVIPVEREVVVDTAAPLVRDAETGLTQAFPLRAGPFDDDDVLPGNLRPRFEGLDEPARAQMDPAELISALRDSIRIANMPWAPIGELSDSLKVQKPWTDLYANVFEGAAFSIREMVWPGHLEILDRTPGAIDMATNWLDIERIPANEVRCFARTEVDEPREGEGAALRMVALLHPIRGGGAEIRVRFETRHLAGCRASPIAWSRLQSFRQDVWMVSHRASAIGTRSIIWY